MHVLLISLHTGEQIKGVIIGTTLGYIQHCAFSPDDSLVAACNNNDVLILRSNVSFFFNRESKILEVAFKNL